MNNTNTDLSAGSKVLYIGSNKKYFSEVLTISERLTINRSLIIYLTVEHPHIAFSIVDFVPVNNSFQSIDDIEINALIKGKNILTAEGE